MQNTQLIAITAPDGTLTLMHFVTRQEPSDAGRGWVREATPANVEAEIAKAGVQCVRWRFIAPSDVPASREHRNRWRDTGTAIEVAP
jgi:hypothetical protein